MKTLNYILAVLLLSIFFVACTAESLDEQTAETAALIEYDQISKTAITQDVMQDAELSEESEALNIQLRDPSEDEDDMPDPKAQNSSDDDILNPNGKDPSEDEDDMPDPKTMP